ncbi:MAG TPA: hypothetical protein VEW46_12035 [Pyrinomonadaceae bacterium]|nr:hypothetical protein [Pyrinomonadaceae bacterium]
MIEGFIHNRRARVIFSGSLIAIAALVFFYFISRQGPSYKELIVAFGGLLVAVIVFGRERGIRYGFVLWVLTLTLGYRTVAVTSHLALHPAEILLWLLLVCVFAQRGLISRARLSFPIWLWLLMPFWVLAWWPMISRDMPWDRMLNEFRDFLLLIPLIIVASVVLKHERYWRYLLLAFFVASSAIALMGTVEYWFPEIIRLFPAFIGKTAKPSITAEGFARAQFAFWGGPPATFICVLALPTCIALMMWWRRRLHRAAIVAASLLQILAIYIGGYRSIWLLLLIQILVACVLRLRKQGAIVALLCVVIAVGGYELIPRTNERAMSGIAALQGRPTDSSAAGRKRRALEAIDTTIEAPFGSGWSSAGWVHSDFLQVAVNLGIIAGLIFFGGCAYTLMRLGRRVLPSVRSGEHGDLGLSLLLSFIAVAGILAMEGATVLPQLVLPVWFVWALVEVWLRQPAEVREFNRAAIPHPYQLAAMRLSPGLKTDGRKVMHIPLYRSAARTWPERE